MSEIDRHGCDTPIVRPNTPNVRDHLRIPRISAVTQPAVRQARIQCEGPEEPIQFLRSTPPPKSVDIFRKKIEMHVAEGFAVILFHWVRLAEERIVPRRDRDVRRTG